MRAPSGVRVQQRMRQQGQLDGGEGHAEADDERPDGHPEVGRHLVERELLGGAEALAAAENRGRGTKNRRRTTPTWFSTWPFSQPEAGVQATGCTR